jgi:hypothetical protein
MHGLIRRVPVLFAGAFVLLLLVGDAGSRTAETVTCSTMTVPRDSLARPISLTGTWKAVDGTYTLRQIGSCLWWVGGRSGFNAFFANISGSTVDGSWADVRTGANGRLTLLVDSSQNQLSRRRSTGSLLATTWRRTSR